MRKLKLEALHVESFDTTPAAHGRRGTVQGNQDAGTTQPGTGMSGCASCDPWSNDRACGMDTHNVNECGETKVFDCTLGGCTANTCDPHVNSCGEYCWMEETSRCVVDPRSP